MRPVAGPTDGQGYGAQHADGSALPAFRNTRPDRGGDLVSDARFDLAGDDRAGNVHDTSDDAFVSDARAQARRDDIGHFAFRFGTVLAGELADHASINCLRAFWP